MLTFEQWLWTLLRLAIAVAVMMGVWMLIKRVLKRKR